MVFTEYEKQRMVTLWKKGCRAPTIAKIVRQGGITASRRGIDKFLRQFAERHTIARRPGSGRPLKITAAIKQVVERAMQVDDETTATQLHHLLAQSGYNISIRTVLRCRTALGWTFRGSAYCQLIREANKTKRLAWAQQHLQECSVGFTNVIWTDECTVQLETHRQFCCRKRGQPPRNKPRYMYSCAVLGNFLGENCVYMLYIYTYVHVLCTCIYSIHTYVYVYVCNTIYSYACISVDSQWLLAVHMYMYV